MSNKKYEINDLRVMLFKQLEKLDDPGCDLDKELKKAEAMVNIGNVIVKSAATEVDYIKAVGAKNNEGSGFIPNGKQIGNGE